MGRKWVGMRIGNTVEQGVRICFPLRDAAHRQAERVGRYRKVSFRAQVGPRNGDLRGER